jgi:MFS transporter, BCD family, chlorophyll transporter
MSEAMLRCTAVTVEIGDAVLLDAVDFEAPPGRIVAVVGPNGAGKTTLLDAISGEAPNMTGTISIGGNGTSAASRRAHIGRVFQGSPLPETLTVAEVCALVAGSRGAAVPILERFGLTPHASSFVSELSTGMRRILDLAIATLGEPSVLLLDEPTSGLAQSEIEHLADLVRKWRDETSSVVIIVEHDAWLVRHLADEVVFMESGKIVAQGSPDKVLKPVERTGKRIASPHDERFKEALGRVAAGAAPAPPLPRRSLSKWTLLRLGLRELSAGMASVLILGVLSRVLKVELGISLGVVTAILASVNLAAPLALAIGHRSDHRPIFGRRRTPYIVAGAIVTGLAVAAAPHVASRLAGGINVFDVLLSLALFAAMGIGMYGAGTVFFALIADKCQPAERGHAASVVYLELMVGVLLGVALTGVLLKPNAGNVGTLFGVAGLLVVALSVIAVWGQDKKVAPGEHAVEPAQQAERPSLKVSMREIANIPMARLFFLFMVLSTLFLFLERAVLQPFGGEVFHMTPRATGGLDAILTIGTIAGMTVAGRPFAEQLGHRRVAIWGVGGSALAFGALAAAAATRAVPPVWLSLMVLGFMSGLFNVASLALMMGMADRRRTALFMGLWTLAHALADGAATAGGGSLFEIARRIFGTVHGGYATVFAVEAIGLAMCIPLLRRIDPTKFMALAAAPAGALPVIPVAGALPPPVAEAVAAAEIPSTVRSNGGAAPPRKRAPAKKPAASGVRTRAGAKPKSKAAAKAKSPVKKKAARAR